MWFDSWADILRVLIVGAVSYATLVGVLRLSGKRTLGQLNAFDFIVTVALGSTLATILLSSDVAYAEGLAALALLAGLQFVVAWISARWPGVRGVVTAEPVALGASHSSGMSVAMCSSWAVSALTSIAPGNVRTRMFGTDSDPRVPAMW